MERLGSFDIARGVAVALVVLLHASLMPYAALDLPQPVCRMAVLLLISGVLAAPTPTRDSVYYRTRALDLLWLLVVWTPILLLTRGGVHSLATLPRELVSPTSHLWYIGGLALLVLTAPVAARAPLRLPLWLSAGVAAWYLAGGRSGEPGWDQMAHFTLFFYLGFYGRDRIAAGLARCGAKLGIAAAVATVLVLTLPVPHVVTTLGSAAGLLLVAQALAPTRIGRGIAWFGRRTPDTYLAHKPLLWLSCGVIGHLSPAGLVLLVPAVIAACLGLRNIADALGLGWLYQRPRLSFAPGRPMRKAFA